MKTTTPSFILELPLKTTPVQESTILVRLEAGRQLYNACLGESLKRKAENAEGCLIEFPTNTTKLSQVYQSAIGRNTVPSSFGVPAKGLPKAPACCEETQSLDQRQSGSPVKPVATITEAADDVIRDTFYEDESRREVI